MRSTSLPLMMNHLSSSSYFEVAHLLSSPAPPVPSSPHFFLQFVPKKPATSIFFMKGSLSSLTSETTHFPEILVPFSLGRRPLCDQVFATKETFFTSAPFRGRRKGCSFLKPQRSCCEDRELYYSNYHDRCHLRGGQGDG